MKKLYVLFLALSTAVFTSCSKDDNEVKPENAILGTWIWEKVISPEGNEEGAYEEIYIEFLENNTFHEIELGREGGSVDPEDIYVNDYEHGDYAFANNKLVTTIELFNGGLKGGTVKVIDNNTIEVLSTSGGGDGYTFILKRSTVNLAPYVEEYKNYK